MRTSGGPAGPPSAVDGLGRRPEPGLPTRQRYPGSYVALAVVLIVGLATLGAWLYTNAGDKTPVVEVVREVPAGQTITRDDLSTVDVAGSVTAVGADRLESMVGQTAAVHLLPHMLLQRAMVSAGPSLDPDQARVGVAVRPGQIPAEGLRAGDKVQILGLPPKEATGAVGQATVLAGAVVFATAEDPSQSGGLVLTVVVPKAASAAVASASNSGLIALVRVDS